MCQGMTSLMPQQPQIESRGFSPCDMLLASGARVVVDSYLFVILSVREESL